LGSGCGLPGISPEEIEQARERSRNKGIRVIGLRFTNDWICTARRFDTLNARAMVRFLLIVSILCAMGAAVLGFLNRAKFNRLTEELGDSRSESAKAEMQLTDRSQQLKQIENRLSTQERLTQQERDARTAELNSTKGKLNQVTEQLAARDSENEALTAALTEAGRNLEQKQRAEQDRQALARRLMEVEDQLNQFRIAANKQNPAQPPTTPEGSILSINEKANALTVSLGTDAGVSANSRLTVVRNGEQLTQLRVVSAELNSSIAQFVIASPDNLSKVAVGDSVVPATK
jgi:DNA repair exonuclease SbcCD ATPase subunit